MPADLTQSVSISRAPRRLGAILSPRIAYGLAAPSVLLLVLTVMAPIMMMILLSFTSYKFGETGIEWIGIGNYAQLFGDRTFRRALWNTFAYVLMVAPASVLLGLFLAVLIDGLSKGQRFYRLIFFLPVTATVVAMAMVWKYLLHGTIGPFNLLLQSLGLPSLDVFGGRDLALAGLAAINIWSLAGFNMVLFAAGLTAVPEDLYEAAAMDGMDSKFDRFLNVTLPLLGPVTMFVIVTSTITAFKVFDTVAVITHGGPRGATDVLLYTTYLEGFSYFRMGSAAAMTVVFLAIMMVFAWIQARVLDRKVHYR
ncbi:sugar ABC transporter permease [Paracoccus onubensis]|uniref:carbohydrate ABC transporter permease n=1 Tax=Paracoccus onubensis TaxID=1675788 RepID=UPI0027320A22|nr:sugar ABC transporter permease [Paracoccus onubensis]MDP0926230.1 sugar ABC transporter permease [Paracoccus onubensis]